MTPTSPIHVGCLISAGCACPPATWHCRSGSGLHASWRPAASAPASGALVIAIVGAGCWAGGRWDEGDARAHLLFWFAFLPALWLAATRHNRLVHHVAALALLGWFATLPGQPAFLRFDYGLLAYGLAVSALFVALGALALDRGGPGLLTAFLPNLGRERN